MWQVCTNRSIRRSHWQGASTLGASTVVGQGHAVLLVVQPYFSRCCTINVQYSRINIYLTIWCPSLLYKSWLWRHYCMLSQCGRWNTQRHLWCKPQSTRIVRHGSNAIVHLKIMISVHNHVVRKYFHRDNSNISLKASISTRRYPWLNWIELNWIINFRIFLELELSTFIEMNWTFWT